MRKVVITSYARTPIGAFLGDLKEVPVQDLATIAVKEAIKRSELNNDDVDEVILGHVISSAEAGNLARLVALKSGLNEATTGFTVNRICGSGLQAVVSAAQEIMLGVSDIVVAGGAESLSRVPYYLPLATRYEGLKNLNSKLLCSNEEYAKHTAPEEVYEIANMGITAENIVERYEISREDQDYFAYQSQMKVKRAVESGRFAQEIVPVEIKSKKGVRVVDNDGHPRPDTTLEVLAKLRPVFKTGGSVTA
jgi:acetyl-CoA C-acetyltransferase